MKILKIVLSAVVAIAFFISCSKEYSLEGGNANLPGGTWRFEHTSTPYNGNIDSSYIESSGSTKKLTITGKSADGSVNFLIVLNTSGSFAEGSYKASSSESQFKYFTPVKTIFEGDFLTGEFTVEIASLSNNTITGTFSGEVADSTGAITEITLGSFISTINLSSNATLAVGTLGGAGSTCSPATLGGTYTQGALLTASNTIQLQVNISQAGNYTIASNSVNGVYFLKTGVFTSTGVQNVILTGIGTPQVDGTYNFTVTFGTSSNCIFSVTFLPGTAPTGDYFPLTPNSNWVYGVQGGGANDSIAHTVIDYSPVIGGQNYSTITEKQYPLSGTADDSLYYRKSSGNYYQYQDIGSAFSFDNSIAAEVIFLKDNVPAGDTWQSQDFSGTIAGVPVTGYIKFTILEKSAQETVGAQTFQDVIKVKAESFLTEAPGVAIISGEQWFARGVGGIYSSVTALGDPLTLELGQYHVF